MLKEMYRFCTPWAKASKVQIQKNRALGVLANILYPPYCKFRKIGTDRNVGEEKKNRVVVSLTSYPARIGKIYLTINSILRQTRPADRVVLWLASTQFPEETQSLPRNLLELQKCGLEIKFVDEDIRSYKKIFYTAQEETSCIIITCDDDTLYPEDWMENLLKRYEEFPDCVVCYRANMITFDDAGKVDKYNNWKGLSPDVLGPSDLLVPIGVGGVLYPAGYFNDVDFDAAKIRELCPTADDLWLKVIGLKKGYKAVKAFENSKEWFTIKSSQKTSLMSVNTTGNNENDRAFKKLINYYGITFGEHRK